MTNETRVYKKAVTYSAWALTASTAVAAGIAWALGGPGPAGSTLAGGATAAVATLGTPLAMVWAAGRSPSALAGAIMGEFLVKVIAVGAVLFALSRVDEFPRDAFGWSLLAGVLASLAGMVLAVTRGRVPYVETGPREPSR